MEYLKGLGVALVTPMDEHRTIDWQGYEKLLAWVTKGGVDYLIVNGTTGESPTVEWNELLDLVQFTFEHAGQLPLWVGAGGNNSSKIFHSIQKLASQFPKIHGFLSVSPYYNKPTQQGIFEHYKYLSQASDKPILLYNIPSRTASEIAIDTILRLAELPTIVGVKDSLNDVNKSMELAAKVREDFILLSGDDSMTLPLMACGYHGVISVLANAKPDTCKKIVNACRQGDFATARKLHYEVLPLIHLLFKEGNPAGIKACLEHLSISKRYVRLPLIEASQALFAELAPYFAAATA